LSSRIDEISIYLQRNRLGLQISIFPLNLDCYYLILYIRSLDKMACRSSGFE